MTSTAIFQMHLLPILQAMALLALANGTPVVAKKLFGQSLALPLDAGLTFFDGRPLFGPSKTIGGIVFSVLEHIPLTFGHTPHAQRNLHIRGD